MICVSIGRGRHRHVVAEHKHLVEQGAKLVELRLDYVNGQLNLRRVLPDRPGPIVFTLRRPQDGGRFPGSEEQRRMLLRTAIVEGVEYVDLEEDVAAEIPRYGKTKRIVSLHDFTGTPENLPAIHARLARLDPDIVKIATMATCTRDSLRMLRLVRDSQIPTIGICMGEIGTPTRLLAGKFGAPFTYATFHAERSLAPGQLSFQQMAEIYGYDRINAGTEVYGVIGDPIAHSYSPHVHNAAFQHLGLNKVYIPFRVAREDLPAFLEDAAELGLCGLSVTIPHKEAILRHLSKVGASVKAVGAVNTVLLRDGERQGFNTDYRAAMDSLEAVIDGQATTDGEGLASEPPRMAADAEANAPEAAEKRPDLRHKTALVLGAGGAAKAIAFGLLRRGAAVVIASRTREHANTLANHLKCSVVDWGLRHSTYADLIINCTPVGMHPNVDESPFDKGYLSHSMFVFDTVYTPEQTLLIKDARYKGCTTITGVDMFVRQAALQFKLFTNQDPPLEVMRDALKRATGAARY